MKNSRTLSEAASKQRLAAAGMALLDERTVSDPAAAALAAEAIGFPVVLKLCGAAIAHKTERGLVRLGLTDAEAVTSAGVELLGAAQPEDGEVELLVAPMVRGNRELIAGASRDPQFGPSVLLGVGGVLAEAVDDAVVALAPISDLDARELIAALNSQALLGQFRGEPAVDVDALVEVLLALSDVIMSDSEIASIDLNPVDRCRR